MCALYNLFTLQYMYFVTYALYNMCTLHVIICIALCIEPARQISQMGLSARQTSWIEQFSIFEALASSQIRRLTFQFVKDCFMHSIYFRPAPACWVCIPPSISFVGRTWLQNYFFYVWLHETDCLNQKALNSQMNMTFHTKLLYVISNQT